MLAFNSNPWNVEEADFPVTGTAAEQVQFLLNYAVLAPSRHNTQPWLFKIEGKSVELYADRSRALPIADPDDRDMVISCGAALANLLIAARHFGYEANLAIRSHPNTRDLLARVQIERGSAPTKEIDVLFSAIQQRRTNRQLFQDRMLPPSLLLALEGIAQQDGAIFQVVQGEEMRYTLASLIANGDHLLWTNERFRREIGQWTRPANSPHFDGVPTYALGTGDMAAYLGPLKIRTFMDNEVIRNKEHLAHGSPVLAVLCTYADTWFDWLAAGQSIERILLLARANNVWGSFFSQPIEVPTLRKELQEQLGCIGFPQLVLRMGYGSEVPTTPRRPVQDALL